MGTRSPTAAEARLAPPSSSLSPSPLFLPLPLLWCLASFSSRPLVSLFSRLFPPSFLLVSSSFSSFSLVGSSNLLFDCLVSLSFSCVAACEVSTLAVCPYLSLFVPICLCLSLSVSVCPYLSLFVTICVCVSLFLGCPCYMLARCRCAVLLVLDFRRMA